MNGDGIVETKRTETYIRIRMARGEGILKTLEIVTGKTDRENAVMAAFELVDHGIKLRYFRGLSSRVGPSLWPMSTRGYSIPCKKGNRHS
jgi:hypothetical protein